MFKVFDAIILNLILGGEGRGTGGGSQKSEIHNPKSMRVGGQKSEVGDQRSEFGNPKSEIRNPQSEILTFP
jgi:hypothetical protein